MSTTKTELNADTILVRIVPHIETDDLDLYRELRGREQFQSAKCVQVGQDFSDADLLSEVMELFSSANVGGLDSADADDRTKQIEWPQNLLGISSDVSEVPSEVFNLSFKNVAALSSLETKIVVAIDPAHSMVTRSFLDALLMQACGNILSDHIEKQNSHFRMDTGSAAKVLRQRIRVVFYNCDIIENERQFTKLGYYLDTALLRICDRFCRALRRKDVSFLSKYHSGNLDVLTSAYN